MPVIMVVFLVMMSAGVSAADLERTHPAGTIRTAAYCPSSHGSYIASLDGFDAMRRETARLYDAALAAFSDPRTQASRRSRHGWADLARISCGIAIGHLDSGEVELDRLNACECNYLRMQRF